MCVNVSAQSMDWMTRCLQALLYLVELCKNIDVPDSDGWTPLMYAATSGSSTIIKYLIQRGANPNLKQVGPIPIPPYPVLSFLVLYSPIFHTRYSIPPFPQSAGFSALYLAAQEENSCICQVLLETGADPNMSGGTQSLSPLHIAAHRLAHSLSPIHKVRHTRTHTTHAHGCRGSKKVCVLLVRYGGDIHQRDTDGDTPLDLADSAELKQAMLR